MQTDLQQALCILAHCIECEARQAYRHEVVWLVGSIKLWASFAREPYEREHILQKRPITLSILLIVATPYVIQPIADRVAKNLEIISKNFQFSTRRTKILVGFITITMLLPGTNRKFHGPNSGLFKKFYK